MMRFPLTSDFKVTTNNYENIFKPQDLGFELPNRKR